MRKTRSEQASRRLGPGVAMDILGALGSGGLGVSNACSNNIVSPRCTVYVFVPTVCSSVDLAAFWCGFGQNFGQDSCAVNCLSALPCVYCTVLYATVYADVLEGRALLSVTLAVLLYCTT